MLRLTLRKPGVKKKENEKWFKLSKMKYFNRLTTGAGKAGKTGRLFLENWLERLDFNMLFSVQAGKAGKVAYICKTLDYCFRFSVSSYFINWMMLCL